MFCSIAPSYDLLNSLMSFSAHKRWRAEAVGLLGLAEGCAALDLCCGTGDFVPCLRHRVGAKGTVVGLDFAEPMLKIARNKNGAEGVFLSGDAMSIPFRSGSFDAVTVGWGIRNVADIDAVHSEIVRVLKPGGRFVSIDMAVPRNALVRAASRLLLGAAIPLLGWLVGQRRAYAYLPESTQRFRTREQLEQSMKAAGMGSTGFRDRMFGNVCIHWGTKP
jgi:demethylmenaquinone methyltransferase/2-methoxy-6-polyprenyl-1,4-benzoquinol methylase